MGCASTITIGKTGAAPPAATGRRIRPAGDRRSWLPRRAAVRCAAARQCLHVAGAGSAIGCASHPYGGPMARL